MNGLSANTMVCGVRAHDLRRLFKDDHFGEPITARVLRLKGTDTSTVLRCLRRQGWIKPSPLFKGAWSPTLKGGALSTVTFGPRIRRATADRLMKGLIHRLQIVNRRGFAFTVESVIVFGSYLSDAPDLGDIDLAVHLRPRHDDVQKQLRLEEHRRSMAPRYRVATEAKRESWPEKEVLVFLRNRSPRFSFHELDELPRLPGTALTKRLL